MNYDVHGHANGESTPHLDCLEAYEIERSS